MTREDFEKLYERVYAKAVAVAGEDAVQETAVYFLERLDSNITITPSLFIQRAVQRGKDEVRPRGVDRNTKRREARGGSDTAREIPVGSASDLEEVERENFRYRTGVDTGRRTPSRGGADDQAR